MHGSLLDHQAGITLAFALLVFGVPCRGPLAALVGLTLLQGTAGMAYGESVSQSLGLMEVADV